MHRERYQRDRHLLVRRLVPPRDIARFLRESAPLPAQRVWCGLDEVSWNEQSVPPDSSLYGFFASITALVRSLLFSAVADGPVQLGCWTSTYTEGEYINPHMDGTGTIQVVLCLETSGARTGGLLGLRTHKDSSRLVALRPGDAAIFDATRVEHFTTPVASSRACNAPRRIVAVARYSFLDVPTTTPAS